MHRNGVVPASLESGYFKAVKPGDVIWIVEVWNLDDAEEEDALVLGRFPVERVTRLGKTTVHASPSFAPRLVSVSLASHKLHLICKNTAGGTGGMCSSRWGTPCSVGGAFARYDRWVRTGWQLTDETAGNLEEIWFEI